ncbi:unnamed protein product [Soboliphyme baturini]|uniref:Uncharacterized protein n=1 Tax=Soboliphyme baturini TaxID=241478 RepID=A0A183IGG4_9BILA|nr:unnamed protein product [Soboliphyme baturini]
MEDEDEDEEDEDCPPLPIPRPVEKEISYNGIAVIENYTGSIVARDAKGRPFCWEIEADGEKSAIRTCSSPSSSHRRSSTTMADEDRRNDDENTSRQRSRYPF